MKLTKEEQFALFVGAVEGGSNYWYTFEAISPIRAKYYQDGDAGADWIWRAIQNGESINVYDVENPKDLLGSINLKNIEKGDQTMQEKSRSHYIDAVNDTWDATTADVWFQYVVMNELVFG